MAAALFFPRSPASRLKLCRYLVGEATTRKGLPRARLERPRLMAPDDGRGKGVVPSKDAGLMQNLNDSQCSANLMGIEYVDCPETYRRFVRLLWGYAPNGLANRYLNTHLHAPLHVARSPRPYLTQMIVHGAIPDLTTFSILIQSYCKRLRYHHIVDALFTQMKAMGVEADESFYETLMDGVCAGFGPLTGFQLLKKLRSRNGIRIPLSCYNVIVGDLVRTRERNRNLSMVWLLIDVLNDMKKHGVIPEQAIHTSLVNARRHLHSARRLLIQAIAMGRQMFMEGIKIGAVSLNIAQRRSALRRLCK